MNMNISRFLTLAVSAVIGLGAVVTVPGQDKALVLAVTADRESYLPGQAVRLTIALTNNSGTSVKTPRPDVTNGTLSIFLARGEGPFKRYDGPDWATRADSLNAAASLAPGDKFEVETTVLYHRFRDVSHLAELYARPLRDAEIGDVFALNRAGQYQLKAVFHNDFGKSEFESVPVNITVIEPDGADALFWESIKDDPDAAWILHTGNAPRKLEGWERDRLMDKIQRLAVFYPDSVHAERFVRTQLRTNQ